MTGPESTTTFRSIAESSRDDWRIILRAARPYNANLADRVLQHLQLLAGDFGGFPVDRLTHSLQAATRASRAGKADDYVACALLHDIGDTLASFNHPDVAAAIVKPFVSEELHWVVEHHGIFQGYFYFEHVGLDPNVREQFRDHPWFDRCAEFVAEFDAPAFDRAYPTLPLAEFEPLLREFFLRPGNTLYAGATPRPQVGS